MSTVIVRLRKQGSEPETLRFDKDEIYIGRLEQNDITLSMTNVSKKHAIVWVDNGSLYVSDAGSTNGTYVNKRRISQPTPLSPTDEVYVGDFVFTVELDQEPSYDAGPTNYEAEASGYASDPVGYSVDSQSYSSDSPDYSGDPSVYPPGPAGYSMGNAASVGGHTSGGSTPGSAPSTPNSGRNMMPPPIRGGASNRPPEDYLASPGIHSSQAGPTPARTGTQRSAPAVQKDELADIYLEESNPPQPHHSGYEHSTGENPPPYVTDARANDSVDIPAPGVSPAPPTHGRGYQPPSRPDYPGSGSGSGYDRHDPSSRPDFSTRSESNGSISNPVPNNTRFGSPQMDAPASSISNRRARHSRSSLKAVASRNPATDADPKAPRPTSGSGLVSSRLKKSTNPPAGSSNVDLFSFPPEIADRRDSAKQKENEELFETFIESLEADGINPLQINPLSEDLLIPYLSRIDADEKVQQAFSDEILQMGPINNLLEDKTVTEIFVNRYDQIIVKRGTKVSYAPLTFHSKDSLLLTARRLASIESPDEVVDGTFADIRFRDNAIATVTIPPQGEDAQPMIVVQRKQIGNESLETLVKNGMLSDSMATFLTRALASGQNIIIAGPIAAQKLRLLSALTAKIPSSVRVLYLSRGHQIQLPSTAIALRESQQKQGDIQQLLSTGVLFRPDRIVLEQISGVEAYSWVTTVSTAIEGCIATISASSTQDVLGNLLTLSMLANHVPSPYAIKEQIARTIDLIVVINNIGGVPRVVSISEVDGVDIGSFRINDIFRFRVDDSHDGHFDATGYIPQDYENLRQSGIDVDISIFRD